MDLGTILTFYDQRGYDRSVGCGVRPALLVIDFSRAFTGGRAAFPGGDFASELAAVGRLAEAARPLAPVIFTTIAYAPDMHDAGLWARKVPWLNACQSGSPLVEIDPALEPRVGDTIIVKKYPSAFFGTGLHETLQRQEIDTLILTGCTTSVCVRATALDAMQHGYRTLVVREAVGDFDPAIHALHLADIGARYCDVVGLEDTLTYLRKGIACPS
jgi:nicotinamidase-related amidase